MRPSVCLVHDWLVAMRGGEKVLEALTELFPEAPIYTLFQKRENLSSTLKSRNIRTTFLQMIPKIDRIYRWLLPLFPMAVRSFNLQQYDLIISSSHCVAKAVRVRSDAVHVCYCHTPMRYLWGFEEEYLGKFPRLIRAVVEFYFQWLRRWDQRVSQGVTAFIANSNNTAKKIRRLYGKKSAVVYPPAGAPSDVSGTCDLGQDAYFLIVSALVPYKKIGVAVEAFNRLRLPLKIVGDGPQRKELEKTARFEGICFEGWVDERTLWERYAHCRALIFPGEEDFGIVFVEAQLLGKAVIAYGKGGATETVLACNDVYGTRPVDQSTGLFFYEQEADSLMEQVKKFEPLQFDPMFIRKHAQQFSREHFCEEMKAFLQSISDKKWAFKH